MPGLTKHLLETCEQLVKAEILWGNEKAELMNSVFKKIERKKPDTFSRAEKVALSEYFGFRFSEGKIAAYIFLLQQTNGGSFTVPATYPALIQWVKVKFPEYVR